MSENETPPGEVPVRVVSLGWTMKSSTFRQLATEMPLTLPPPPLPPAVVAPPPPLPLVPPLLQPATAIAASASRNIRMIFMSSAASFRKGRSVGASVARLPGLRNARGVRRIDRRTSTDREEVVQE